MKKYLIALPLVLIMILSMVPVMAAQDLLVGITYYKDPQKTDNFLPENKRITIADESILTDAKKLKAEVEKQVEALGFPKLDTDVQPEWVVEAKVEAAEAEKVVLSQTEGKYSDLALSALMGMNKNVVFEAEKDVDLTDTATLAKVATTALATKYNAAITDIVAGKPGKVVIASTDVQDKDTPAVEVSIASVVSTVTEAKKATASAIAYPKCFVDAKDEEKAFCPELCKEITVRVVNAYTDKEIVDAARKYTVNQKNLPTYEGIFNHYVNTFMPRGYQILKEWNLRNKVVLPSTLDKKCTITIYVLPLEVKVDVYHVLRDCCIDLNGNVKYETWKVFEEKDQTVPFIEYHTDLVINQDRAKDFALTRLQKINATDFVFLDAFFDDGVRLDNYMTGEVYDLDGNKVMEIKNVNPRITIRYNRADCQKDEEQVDNATVENTNTQAPVTASGTQLPATGAKDVTAFFLSAVALLGLGIFFAKKH